MLALYESVFVVAALATALVVGTLRTAESASRMRARGLSRRTIQAESHAPAVAEAIHDGPVQELIGLDMILSAAASPERGARESVEHIEEARRLAMRNLRALRDEIVDLGPYAFEELTFDTAIETCIPVWKRRHGFEVMATIERIPLPEEMPGDLFRIAQEAVLNAGRHSGADAVSISLRSVGREIELRITDNGHGFQDETHSPRRNRATSGLRACASAPSCSRTTRHRDFGEGDAGARQGPRRRATRGPSRRRACSAGRRAKPRAAWAARRAAGSSRSGDPRRW